MVSNFSKKNANNPTLRQLKITDNIFIEHAGDMVNFIISSYHFVTFSHAIPAKKYLLRKIMDDIQISGKLANCESIHLNKSWSVILNVKWYLFLNKYFFTINNAEILTFGPYCYDNVLILGWPFILHHQESPNIARTGKNQTDHNWFHSSFVQKRVCPQGYGEKGETAKLLCCSSAAALQRIWCTNNLCKSGEVFTWLINCQELLPYKVKDRHRINIHCIGVIEMQWIKCCEGNVSSLIQVSDVFDKTSTGKITPALGISWANQVTVRLMLRRTQQSISSTIKDQKLELHGNPIRTMEVLFAPHLPSSLCHYIIDHDGVKGLT